MALIKCPECGKEISDKAAACINCGFPLSELSQTTTTNNTMPSPKANIQANKPVINKSYIPGRPIDDPVITESPTNNDQATVDNKGREVARNIAQWIVGTPTNNSTDQYRLVCARCNSSNIQFNIEHVNQIVGSNSEVRKKSIVTRTGNRIGRSTMTLLTGGLWGLLPKRSDYNEVTRVKSRNIEYKTAICKDCGYSWPMN